MKMKSIITTSVAAIAAILVGSLFMSTRIQPASVANAQNANSSLPQKFITVVGEGTVNIKPDIAKTTVGVDTVKATVKEASDENQQILSKVLESLKAAGVAEKDIQTSGFNIYTEQFGTPDSGTQNEPTYRYHVTNQLLVVIRDIDKVGEVLDAAIEAGANNSYGVEFRLDDQKTVRTDARALAVANAQNKAQNLAELTGVTVGSVLSVSEVIGNSPFYSSAQAIYGLGGGGDTPISAGELQLTMQVQVTYAIE